MSGKQGFSKASNQSIRTTTVTDPRQERWFGEGMHQTLSGNGWLQVRCYPGFILCDQVVLPPPQATRDSCFGTEMAASIFWYYIVFCFLFVCLFVCLLFSARNTISKSLTQSFGFCFGWLNCILIEWEITETRKRNAMLIGPGLSPRKSSKDSMSTFASEAA